MDESIRRNYIIEEQFPDGKAKSGFTYSYTKLDAPPDTIALEIKMTGGDTLRLFFNREYFNQFASETHVVQQMVNIPA